MSQLGLAFVSYHDALCHVTKNKDLLEYFAILNIRYVL